MIVTITFVLYFFLVFYIGWVAYKRTKNLSDYILGGRTLGRWTAAISAGASDMSGWLLLGLPGYAYLAGLEATWIALGLLAGTYSNWKWVAPRLRTATEANNNAITLPEYFEYRFKDTTHVMRIVTAFFILLFFLFYTSSGLVAGGKLFESVFGLPYQWAVFAGAAAILLYTAFGGFLAVAWTDLFQGLLMALALAVCAVMAVSAVGGPGDTLSTIYNENPALTEFFSTADGAPLGGIAWLSLLGWGLGYFGQPHIVVRFMAIQNEALVKDARRIAVSWSALSMLSALIVGITGIALLETPLIGADSETVFMELVQLLFHPAIAGICLAAILAAIMSTADSQLLVSSSAVTEDFYKALFKNDATERELVITGRIAVVVIAIIATALAMDPDAKVLELVSYAWAGFGAAFGPAIILSLYWNGMTRQGAIAGILTGALTVIIWKQLEGGIFDLYELVPAFILSMLCIVLASKLTRAG